MKPEDSTSSPETQFQPAQSSPLTQGEFPCYHPILRFLVKSFQIHFSVMNVFLFVVFDAKLRNCTVEM